MQRWVEVMASQIRAICMQHGSIHTSWHVRVDNLKEFKIALSELASVLNKNLVVATVIINN
jgi:hypothetical protein